MSILHKQPIRLILAACAVLTILAALTQTAFTYQDPAKRFSELLDDKRTETALAYQGQLKEGDVPANGNYTFRFALYSRKSGGRELETVIKDDVVVTNGLFSVPLNFSGSVFSKNESWLEIAVRPTNSAGAHTTLSPRQRFAPTENLSTAQAGSWSLIGVRLSLVRDADRHPATVDAIKDQSVTSENFAATQDSGIWTREGTTVGLSKSTDSVGIGTIKPKAKLDVAGDIHASEAVTVGNSIGLLSAGALNLIEVDSNPLAIGFSNPVSVNPNPLAFATVRVGIGTTAPTNTLDVNGRLRVRTLTPGLTLNDVVVANFNGVLFTRPANTLGGGPGWLLSGNSLATGNEFLGTINNFPLRIFTNNTERMRILTNGNVGLGTTAPTQTLTLGSGNIFLPNANGGTDGNLYFGGITDSNQVGMRLFGGNVNATTPGGFIDVRVNPGNLSDGLRFRVDANNGGAERMRITAAGNVGIGTTAPAARLSIGNNTFQVDGAGNLVRINNITYSWPATQGAANTILTNNGSGVLTWSASAGGGVSGTCSSGLNFVSKWSALSALTCSQIFDSGTNVGIGTITPNERLEITGNFRLPASTATVGVIKSGANRFIHNFGVDNFFAGVNAGNLTMSACCNTALGKDAFQSNSSGNQNSALGLRALMSNLTGSTNTAIGAMALQNNTTGHNNVAVGASALLNNVSGRDNIAVGTGAGLNVTTGSFNVYIGNAAVATNESNTVRIGIAGASNRTFIAGIRNTTTGVANAVPVLIDGNGQLGTLSSSGRFKEHIESMGAASDVLYRLRPVTFLYKPEYGGRADLPQFGLIAEDVAKVAPALVANDDQGKPYTVYYHFLVPMLLNEMQKKDSEIEAMRKRLDSLEKLVEALTKK